MYRNVSSSTVVFVLACLILASTAYSQPRGSQPQQGTSTHNFYITTPQTGEQSVVGTSANEQATAATSQATAQQTLNTYTATTTWQPQAREAASAERSSSRSSRQSNAANSQAQQVAQYNTYNNYYTAAASQQTAQQTVYPSYVAHASATHTSEEKKGLLSRLLHRNQQQQPKITQVSNNAARRSRYSGTVQNGTASWYGSDWHGKKTANGERYNMESMTAAHRSLPFGTLVKVRNERNGRECVVRINNRGPFTKGRILDLSKAAARHLGMVSSGVAKIKMEVLGSQS